MAIEIVLLGDHRQRREVMRVAHARRVDALLGQERAIGRYARRHIPEQRQRACRQILLAVVAVEQAVERRGQELRSASLARADC